MGFAQLDTYFRPSSLFQGERSKVKFKGDHIPSCEKQDKYMIADAQSVSGITGRFCTITARILGKNINI